jgi:hypothetical protein
MHRANTYYDEEQPYSFENSTQHHIEQPPTETEEKALHFFETGMKSSMILLKTCFDFSRRFYGCCLLFKNCVCLDMWFGKK